MNPPGPSARALPIRFGVFEVDVVSGELRKRGLKVKLQEQPFQALLALLRCPREIVTRDELRAKLWPADIVVDFDSGLNKAINRLREALGDDADNPRFIETVPQRGYRFLADVEVYPVELSGEEAGGATPKKLQIGRRELVALTAGTISIPLLFLGYRSAFRRTKRIESIGVLPLDNLSGDVEQEYFSDGMTDALIGEIARIGGLRVISRTSMMRYKHRKEMSLPQIARELQVDSILEGTVLKSGSKVRITAQLIRAVDDRHVLSEQYERELTDLIAVQREIARDVAGLIQMELAPSRRSGASTIKPAAYDVFLKGDYFLAHGMRGVNKSIELFRQSIALDPSFADAHAALAEAFCYAGVFGFIPSEAYDAARSAARHALQLDESNARAHNALANVRKGYDWDLAGAEVEYKRALQLNASHLLTRLWYAECLARMKRYDESIQESGKAVALDPVSPNSHGNRAMLFFRARRYSEAIQSSQQALELDPSFVNALWWQGMAYAGNLDFPKSIVCFTRAIGMNGPPLFRALLGYAYARAGEQGKALAVLAELTKSRGYVSPVDVAIVYAGLGDADSSFQWLERAYQARATRIHDVAAPYFDAFRNDARYADLLRRVGLPA